VPGRWVNDELLVVDGVEFTVRPEPEPYLNAALKPDRFVISKTTSTVERLIGLAAELSPRRVVQLGQADCGATMLLALLARPDKLSAIDVGVAPPGLSEELLALQGLADVVVPHHGVDEGETQTLTNVVDTDHGNAPLDLVIDDASHLYRETRATFEVLFPRLRPGGVFVMLGWSWAHMPGPQWQDHGSPYHDRPALTNLVVEVVMVAASEPDLVSKLTIDRDMVVIERGSAAVEVPIHLEDHYLNRRLSYRPLI
jgi:predicted O-methyltransferase YrrM